MWTTRAARNDDVQGMTEVILGQPLFGRYGCVRPRLGDDLSVGIARGDTLVLAESGTDVVGVAWMLPQGAFGRSPYLRLLAVRQGWEGKGIGAALLAEVEQRVPSHKGGWFLLVSAFNVGARRFYERHGYGLVGKLPGFALADVTELVLWKPADPCAATESGEGVDAR